MASSRGPYTGGKVPNTTLAASIAVDQDKQIREIAAAERTTVSAVVRRALDAYLRTAYPAEQRAASDAADEGGA